MQIRIASDAPASVQTGALVVPVFAGEPLVGVARAADEALGGALSKVIAAGEIGGKLCEVALLHALERPFTRLLAVGLGTRTEFEPHLLSRYAACAVRHLGKRNVERIAIALPDGTTDEMRTFASFVAEGAITGSFETTLYQQKPERPLVVSEVVILADDAVRAQAERGAARGIAIGEAVNRARRMAATPANDMTPTRMGEEARKVADAHDLRIDVHDDVWARAQGMGSFLSVAQGSAQPPVFIVMRYEGDPGSKELLALVGKGITFDTGGISIKPAERMEDMKYDMSGGAAVIAAMDAIARLKLPINVVGLVPATENMPGGKATKPGDIVRAMNGTSIEIINTDAEGRLILADALCYARKLGATRIVDAATLTGACVVALGHAAAAAVSNDDAFVEEFLRAAAPTGERFWRMPLYEDYSRAMRSEIADLKNTGGRAAGTLTAAAFLKAFVEQTPWVHLDIAGTAYLDTESAWQPKGPTGLPVRSFVALAERLSGAAAPHGDGARTSATVG
jgi:leucyl aminopeptidase